MGIINRRNAVLGWSVWQVGKMSARRKARQSARDGRRPSKGAIVGSVAALGGALWFWRRRRGGDESA